MQEKHYFYGKKENFEKHPDYIPSVFPGRTKDNSSEMGKMDRVNRRINRTLSKECEYTFLFKKYTKYRQEAWTKKMFSFQFHHQVNVLKNRRN